MGTITTGTVEANGVSFGYLAAGDVDDRSRPLALCLHGFPDSAHTWRHLLPGLAGHGYRAVAPFQRGYAPTAVPADGLYQSGVLAADAIALHEAFGGASDAVLIGHDWGASATHGAAVAAPDRFAKVVSMAVPPGPALGLAFLGDLAQVKRSWYMFFFQHGLADVVVGNDDLAFLDMLWRDWSPGFDASGELPAVKAALGEPANLAAALGYYRATLGAGRRDPSLDELQAATQGHPTQPALYLHGHDDGCIGVEVAIAARSTAPPNVTVEVIDGCGHFLQLERPDVVNDRVLRFLG